MDQKKFEAGDGVLTDDDGDTKDSTQKKDDEQENHKSQMKGTVIKAKANAKLTSRSKRSEYHIITEKLHKSAKAHNEGTKEKTDSSELQSMLATLPGFVVTEAQIKPEPSEVSQSSTSQNASSSVTWKNGKQHISSEDTPYEINLSCDELDQILTAASKSHGPCCLLKFLSHLKGKSADILRTSIMKIKYRKSCRNNKIKFSSKKLHHRYHNRPCPLTMPTTAFVIKPLIDLKSKGADYLRIAIVKVIYARDLRSRM